MTHATTEDDPHIGEWVSTREAAARLKITERSVFRRIQRGQLEKKQTDGNVMVFLTDHPSEEAEVMSETPAHEEPQPEVSSALAVRVMHVHMSGEIFREELRERDRQLAALAEELGLLRAELSWRRLPWWQRMLGIMTPPPEVAPAEGKAPTGQHPGGTDPPDELGLAAGAEPSNSTPALPSAGLKDQLRHHWRRLSLGVLIVGTVVSATGYSVVDASDGRWDGVVHACESILAHAPHP